MGIIWCRNHGPIDMTEHVLHLGDYGRGNAIPAGQLLGPLAHGLNEGNHLYLIRSESCREMRTPGDHASTHQGQTKRLRHVSLPLESPRVCHAGALHNSHDFSRRPLERLFRIAQDI